MAKKHQTETPADSGLAKIGGTDSIVIPDPIPVPVNRVAASVAPAQKRNLSNEHARAIAEGLFQSMGQNRLARLKSLSRVNRDVKWLLDEYNKQKN